MRLIDADALKKSFCENCMCNMGDKMCGANCVVQQIIEIAPEIEAEPVRHGRWEERKWEDMKADSGLHTIASARCSECGLWCEQVRDWTARIEYKFCPSCGARMDGGAEDG